MMTNLSIQNERLHGKPSEKFQCNECNSEFSSKSNLNRHVSTTHGQNPRVFPCTVCEKTFGRHDTLLKHETIEHNKRQDVLIIPGVNDERDVFECNHCEKIYKTKFSLLRHIESKHVSKRFHECNICGKCYNRKDVLEINSLTHNQRINRIVCEVCRAEFPSKQELRIHRIKTHDS